MSAELRERLGDLADQVPPLPPPPDLWDRGRRYGRRRTLTQVVVASCCLLLLAAAASTAWQTLRAPEFEPARGEAPARLPDRFFNPSPWLRGTDAAGPLGPLAAVIPADRKTWTSTRPGFVGVSATTGDYRFLDLPGSAGGPEFAPDIALAPDGRHVAYWLTGETTGEPAAEHDEEAIVGLAIYDPVTGETTRERFETKHGLHDQELIWADSETLIFQAGQILGGRSDDMLSSTSSPAAVRIRELASADSQVFLPASWNGSLDGSSGGGLLTVSSGDSESRFGLLDSADPEQVRWHTATPRMGHPYVVSLDGERVASTWPGSDPSSFVGNTAPITAGRVGPDGTVRMRKIPGHRGVYGQAVGWFDAQHVAFLNFRTHQTAERGPMLEKVDISTGDTEQVVEFENGLGNSVQIATVLLATPPMEAKAPAEPWDPRVKVALLAAAAASGLCGLVTLVRWRRRGRA